MTGEIKIKVTPIGIGVDASIQELGPMDKFELMHALSIVLKMDRADLEFFHHLEQLGILRAAEQVKACGTPEELENCLQGKQSAQPDMVENLSALATVLKDLLDELKEDKHEG